MRKKYKTPGEVIASFNGNIDLDMMYIEMITYGNSHKLAIRALKLFNEGKEINKLIEKKENRNPIQW